MIIATLSENSNKLIGSKSRTPDDSEDDDDEVEVVEPGVGWAYIGSHNFTPSAWGTLSGSSFNPILNVRSLSTLFALYDRLVNSYLV